MQLGNNIILGIPEQLLETYENTKQRIYDTFTSAIQEADPSMTSSALDEGMKVDIVYCSRIDKQKLGQNCSILVTLCRHDHKEKIMIIKSKLPQGIYINNEYQLHIKRVRDTLQPILRYTKTIPSYRDKCKIKGDHLVISRINYGIHDIDKLPSEIAAYNATQKKDNHYIAFHRELSPCSNFHWSHFTINNHTYHSSEQWIQFQNMIPYGYSLT